MPVHPMFSLYRKSKSGAKLTRNEKDTIACRLYGIGGANGPVFKCGGFAANFSDHLPRFLVHQHGSWRAYYAPDRTSLRKALFGRIDEIVSA